MADKQPEHAVGSVSHRSPVPSPPTDFVCPARASEIRASLALFATLVGFTHILAGFTNRQLVQLVLPLLDAPYTSRQATYDLRRLRRKGLIERLPGAHRYQLTPLGRTVAVLFAKTYGRVLCPGFVMFDLALPDDIAPRDPLHTAWRQLDDALDAFMDNQMIAAA